MTRNSKLGAFAAAAAKPAVANPAAPATPTPALVTTPPTRRRRMRRADKPTVGLTIQIPREDWRRLREVADAEGATLVALMLEGLSRVLAARGLPPMSEYVGEPESGSQK